MSLFRLWTLIFSLFVHGGVAALLLAFSDANVNDKERVYRVSLAEFAEPQRPEITAPQNFTPPYPEKKVEPEPEKPVVQEPQKPVKPTQPPKPERVKPAEAKTISPRKTEEPVKEVSSPSAPPQPAPAAPSYASSPQPQQIGGLAAFKADQIDQRPSISRRVTPEYPSKARRMNIEGKVVVQVVVDTNGIPKACTVVTATPSGQFEEAALKAAERMRFIPGTLKGRPVNTLVHLPFVFSLR